MPRPRNHSFTSSEIDRALDLLDSAIGKSDLLVILAPIRFICFGGALAVKVFQNRTTTEDIDIMLDPNIEAVSMYQDEIRQAISAAAVEGRYQDDWFSDACRLFIAHEKRPRLFAKSMAQDIVVYRGQNLVIYAASLESALERKLRRLDSRTDRDRGLDLSDAVALVHALRGEHPVGKEYVRALDMNEFSTPVKHASIDMVAEEYLRKHQQQGIVEMVWDENHQCRRYTNLEGELVLVPRQRHGIY
ncbi:hypothetical protein F5Y12DRAFT_795618 [Xylaria sp. FL1777]|nr:hypothetical protein F5Y12DRAFT_795618 [Xylaria sp. FL1777]